MSNGDVRQIDDHVIVDAGQLTGAPVARGGPILARRIDPGDGRKERSVFEDFEPWPLVHVPDDRRPAEAASQRRRKK